MSTTPQALDVILSRINGAPARLGPADGSVPPVRLVCIDGPAGSGKTTLAEQLQSQAGAHVVHMDDVYNGWTGLLSAPQRIAEQIIAPMAAGEPGRFQRYDWHADAYADWVEVPRAALVVIEGCGSGSRVVAEHVGLLIWVAASDDLRLHRGLERDGEQAMPQWQDFMADERILYSREQTPQRADLHLDAWGELTSWGQ